MGDTATPAELNAAQEIVMEDSGENVAIQEEENTSLFDEVIPEFEDENGTPSSEVKSAPSQSSDADSEDSKNTGTNDDENKSVDKPGDEDEEPGNANKPENSDQPGELAKVIEHKTNLEKALSAERAKNKSLQFMLDQQKEQPAPTAENRSVNPDFKVLTPEEFAELKDEDAVEAMQYLHDLQDHKDAVLAEKQAADQIKAAQDATNALIADSVEQIALALPGVYEDEAVGQKLTAFAVDKGFDSEDLGVLSNPGTMVIPQGSDKPVPLGKAAVSFVKFCNETMNNSNDSQLRSDIEKEVTEKVTAQLIKKFKSNPESLSLDDVPAANNGAPEKWTPKTEAELSTMTEEERDAYYSGQ